MGAGGSVGGGELFKSIGLGGGGGFGSRGSVREVRFGQIFRRGGGGRFDRFGYVKFAGVGGGSFREDGGGFS